MFGQALFHQIVASAQDMPLQAAAYSAIALVHGWDCIEACRERKRCNAIRTGLVVIAYLALAGCYLRHAG